MTSWGRIASLPSAIFTRQNACRQRLLTHYVEWAGKYPIPFIGDRLLPRTLPTGDSESIRTIEMEKGGDIEATKQLAKRLRRMLPERIRIRLTRTTPIKLPTPSIASAQIGTPERLTCRRKNISVGNRLRFYCAPVAQVDRAQDS